jgi:signal transduction histidine kinase
MVNLEATRVEEYRQLNDSVKNLLQRNIETFTSQKLFIENVSHELQTPLAVATAKLETWIEKCQENVTGPREIADVLTILGRMKRLNSQLLLLSKIKNRQFPASAPVDLRQVLESVLDELEELIAYKRLTVEKQGDATPARTMNPDLAHVLLANLLKNAIAHNHTSGHILVRYASDSITIANSGETTAAPVFDRYKHDPGVAGTPGLGLSIVKSITELYGITLTYHHDRVHVFTLSWT